MTSQSVLARTTWAGSWLHEHTTVTPEGALVASLADLGQSYRVRLNGFREGLLVFVDGSVLLIRQTLNDGTSVIDPRIWQTGGVARSYKEATTFPNGLLPAIRAAYTGPMLPVSTKRRLPWAPKPNVVTADMTDWALNLWARHSAHHTELHDGDRLTLLSDGTCYRLGLSRKLGSIQSVVTLPQNVSEGFKSELERSPWGANVWFENTWVFTHRGGAYDSIVARCIEHTPLCFPIPKWSNHARLLAASRTEQPA